MKKIAKILSVALCLAMVLSMAAFAFAAGESYEQVAAADVTNGEYVLATKYNDIYYAVGTTIAQENNNKMLGIEAGASISGELPTWTVEVVDGGITLKAGDSYLSYTSGTNLVLSETPYTWTLAPQADGSLWITNGSTRGIAYRYYKNEHIFGAYATSNATNPSYSADYSFGLELYKLAGNETPGGGSDVEPLPPTGDTAPVLMAVVALMAAAGLIVLVQKKRAF